MWNSSRWPATPLSTHCGSPNRPPWCSGRPAPSVPSSRRAHTPGRPTRPRVKLGLHAIQRRDPTRGQVGPIARAEEQIAPGEHVLVGFVPAEARSGPERLGDLGLGASRPSASTNHRAGKSVRPGRRARRPVPATSRTRHSPGHSNIAPGGLAAQPRTRWNRAKQNNELLANVQSPAHCCCCILKTSFRFSSDC